MSRSELELDIGTRKMLCTTEEVSRTLSALLNEMRLVIPFLRPDERELLRHIMRHASGSLTVRDVFPEFARDSERHKTLRRLRAAQFVRPAESGRWLRDEPIEVKPFARLMWDHLGEAEIFSAVDARPGTPKAEVEAAPERPAGVSAVDDAPVAPAAPVDVETLAAALWEDDDVLDLRDMATK